MSKLFILVGLPASGKSTYAEKLAIKEKAIIMSSDSIRQEIYGGTKNQKQAVIFGELYRRTEKLLKEGQNVIIDATNNTRERRQKIIEKFYHYQKECIYFNTPFESAYEHNLKRERTVDERKMKDYFINTQIPIQGEGWDKVHLIHQEKRKLIDNKDEFESFINKDQSYEELFAYLNQYKIFKDIYQFNQDSIYHKHTLCMHTYHVYKYVLDNFDEEEQFVMRLVALLHDVGKPMSQIYKKNKEYASYFGHENVSAQLACNFLYHLGYEDEFILNVCNLIQLHMMLLKIEENPSVSSDIYHLIGDDNWKMYIFREGDNQAKG